MQYEGSIGFVSEKLKKIIVDLHVSGLFRHKKHDLGEKTTFCLSRAGAGVRINLCHAYSLDHKN
jgi:hypothetical protein